jgi:proline iminopeptidase
MGSRFITLIVLLIAGAIALFLAIALYTLLSFTHQLWLMRIGAIASCLVLGQILGAFVGRRLGRQDRGRVGWAIAGVLIAFLSVSLFVPRSVPAAVAPVGTQFWQLSNGSRIAYLPLKEQSSNYPPIVFLHGGPGLGLSLDRDLNFFTRFAQAGYDLYKYDQVGSGFSSRLADVRQYTIARQVEDLELIRQQIGATQMILWGQSWGGSLAMNYLAQYPDRVAKMILTSSGTYWWPWQPGAIQWSALRDGRLSLRERLGYAIAPHNPLAAAQLMTQAESGYAWAVSTEGLDFIRLIQYCPDALPPRSSLNLLDLAGRVNLLVNRLMTQSVTQGISPRSQLVGNSTPILYLRGSCDDGRSLIQKQDYQEIFWGMRSVQIAGAGHKLWNAPNTENVAEMILAFLQGKAF